MLFHAHVIIVAVFLASVVKGKARKMGLQCHQCLSVCILISVYKDFMQTHRAAVAVKMYFSQN